MNLKKLGRTFWVIAAVAMLAMVLQGCGGDDNGVDQSLHDTVTMERDGLQMQINALVAALGATDVAGATDEISSLQMSLQAIQAALGTTDPAMVQNQISQLQADLKKLQDAEKERMDTANDMMQAAMIATAAKLHAGISAPGGTGADTRTAAYGTGNNANNIVVTIGTATPVNLSEDDKTMVYDLHGWEGKRYTAEPEDDGMYEAVVYSNVGELTMGKKFGGAAANDEFEYELTNGMVSVDTSTAGVPARVALDGVTRTAGMETFNLPDPNPGGATMILVPGSFHGVSGTYSCTPSTPADGCSASVAEMGFTLAAGAWTFKPSDPNARVTDTPDNIHASYGWWIHKAENDGDFTASAFVSDKGDVPNASGIDTLMGTATYMGGAAGKYALKSSTGGTNDAGHFTARAMLEADFNDDMITGTIDMFMGADGEMRNWSVELMESGVSATGTITGSDGAGDPMMTKWTIDGTAADAAGQWSGTLQNNGDDGVPMVGTGTFYSMFGSDGRMVGAFGVNRQ